MKKTYSLKREKAKKELMKDIFLILFGTVLALILTRLGIIYWLVNSFGSQIFASFFSGIFFTSVFTISPASIALASISGPSPLIIALWGALGALCGDLILFFFIRDRFSEDIMSSMKPSVSRYILSSLHLGFMKWLSPLLGALIIASPLPDEFGVALLGLSKTKISVLIPISFIMNFMGIYLLLQFAQVI